MRNNALMISRSKVSLGVERAVWTRRVSDVDETAGSTCRLDPQDRGCIR